MFGGGRGRNWSKGRGQQGFNLTIPGSAEEVAIPEKLFFQTFWCHQIPQISYLGPQSVYPGTLYRDNSMFINNKSKPNRFKTNSDEAH